MKMIGRTLVCVIIVVVTTGNSVGTEAATLDIYTDRKDFKKSTIKNLLTESNFQNVKIIDTDRPCPKEESIDLDYYRSLNVYAQGRNASISKAISILSCDKIQQYKEELTDAVFQRCQCYCYTNASLVLSVLDLKVHNCLPGNSRNFYSLVRHIVHDGGWKAEIAITDLSSPVIPATKTTLLHQNCSIDVETLRVILHQNSPIRLLPYRNIVILCPVPTQIEILRKLYKSLEVDWIRFNLVLFGVAENEFHENVKPLLRDGDNVAIIYTRHSVSLRQIVKASLNDSLEDKPWGIIKGCVYDCHTTKKLSLIADFLPGFQLRPILPGVFTQFHGKSIRVALDEYRPFYIPKIDENGTKIHEGLDINILKAAADVMNFTFEVVNPPDGAWGSVGDDGNWTGMIGMVARGEADMSAAGMSVSYERSTVVDFTYQYYEEMLAFVLKVAQSKWYFFLEPFNTAVWTVVLLYPFFIWIGIRCFYCATNEIRGITHTSDEMQYKMDFSIIGSNLLLQGTPLYRYSNASYFLMSGYWLTIIVIAATYAGNLTASLAVPVQIWPFQDLQGLAQSDWTILLYQGNMADTLFKFSPGGTYKDIGVKISQNPMKSYITDDIDPLKKVESGEHVFVSDYTAVVDLMYSSEDCGLAILPERFFPTGIAVVLPKGSPYKARFDEFIMKLAESGLIVEWYKDYMSTPTCLGVDYSAGDPITLDAVFLVLLVLASGVIISAFILVLEMVWKKHLGENIGKKVVELYEKLTKPKAKPSPEPTRERQMQDMEDCLKGFGKDFSRRLTWKFYLSVVTLFLMLIAFSLLPLYIVLENA